MKKILLIFFAITLSIGFAYVIEADAQCGQMGGGCGGAGHTSMRGCNMGAMSGSSGAGCRSGGGMSGCGMGMGMGKMGMGAMKGSCETSGCACGAGCSGPGCACGSMSGMGGSMMGGQAARQGMGNPLMKVFLEDTKELRKELHVKKFEYSEAARNFDVPVEDLMKMEKEITILQMKINRYWLK